MVWKVQTVDWTTLFLLVQLHFRVSYVAVLHPLQFVPVTQCAHACYYHTSNVSNITTVRSIQIWS